MNRGVFCLILLAAQVHVEAESARLPLPVSGPPGAQSFESTGPVAAVLTGFLVPSAGPLTSWAPLFSDLQANGRLANEQPGAWRGPLPARWIKVGRPGAVVGGLRVLVRTGPGSIQTRQIQVFWQPWNEGHPQGPVIESQVYGEAAAKNDDVRIVELRVPAEAVAVGFYGQLFAGAVIQTSLLVRLPETAPKDEIPQTPLSGPTTPAGPSFPSLTAPSEPLPTKP